VRCLRRNGGNRRLSPLRVIMAFAAGFGRLERKVDRIMATVDDLSNALERVNVSTSNIAGDVRSLKEQIDALATGQPVTQEELDRLTARAEGIATNLEGVAAETPDAEPA
jgi:methyl-accepting chemotaxis protein